MTHREALEVLAGVRGDRVVIATMGSNAIWPGLSDTPLDFAFIPSSMGQAPALGLGLTLATGRRVVVLSGDGSLLMNLGCLVTLANTPADVFLILIDNGLYEVTGGQPVAGAGRTDFAGLARAAGIRRVYTFADAASWRSGAAETLGGKGPVFVGLQVDGVYGQKTPTPPRPMRDQIERLRSALGVRS
jgi:thiamine pyrophosphate-dependent acetolactate synthase large subunit-like protein